MSPESIQEVIHRHTSHFTSLQGKEYHWNHPDLPAIREAMHETEKQLKAQLSKIKFTVPEDQFRELLGDIYKALQIRRQELL